MPNHAGGRIQSSSGSATATELLGRLGRGLIPAVFQAKGSRGDAGGLRRKRRIKSESTRLSLRMSPIFLRCITALALIPAYREDNRTRLLAFCGGFCGFK